MCDSCGDARRVTQVSRRDFLKTGAVAAYALSPAIGTGGTVAPTAVAQATKRNPQNAAEVRMKRIAIEEAFVTQDPFILEGLVKSYVIRNWNDKMLI